METIELKITCRIEELSVIGRFLLDSMIAGLVDFTALSPKFNAAYISNVNAKMAAIDALVNPKQYTAEMKVITLRIYGNMEALRPKIDFLEFYIKSATGLTIAKKDFGIHEVRKENKRGDVEGLIAALGFLLTNVTNNMIALVDQGYTPAQHSALITMRTDFTNDNAAQNTKENDRNNKVIANYGLLNEFWAICTEISDAGKRIYKSTAANKVDDFTIAELKRRIRQEQKRNKFTGVVTVSAPPPEGEEGVEVAVAVAVAGIVFEDVRVELIPVTVGRRRVTKSNAKGIFIIKSLTVGEYIATFTAKDADSKTSSIVIETGKTTTLNVNMIAKAGSELATKLK